MKRLVEYCKNHKKICVGTTVIGLFVLGGIIFMLQHKTVINDEETALSGFAGPTVYFVENSFVRGEEVTVDVACSGLVGEYPAASFKIAFDKNKLEFKEIKQGNVEITNKKNGEVKIPEWQFDEANANNKGVISTMYVDMTGENNPITGDDMTEGSDVIFRLTFCVKDSCNDGEELQLSMQQATFAAIDQAETLSMKKGNINTPDGKFTVSVQ